MPKASPQQQAWITNPKIGSEAMLSGDFGESFIAYLLSKEGIDVARASTVGFDLLAIDTDGKIFPKDQIACISVKARISKNVKLYRPTIPVSPEKLRAAAKIWRATPWVGIVVGSTHADKPLDAFIFPLKDLPKLRGVATREGVVAVTDLFDKPTARTKKLF